MDPTISDALREVGEQLCQLSSELSYTRAQNSPSLVFPLKRSASQGVAGTVRVSEAEARLLFALAMAKRTVPFAVEAPTAERYSFKGSTSMSARTDLLVYSPASPASAALSRRLGVEFKAHNAPPESIRKDLEKLLREGHDGLWFHVLQNIDSGTLVALFKKFAGALEGMASVWAQNAGELTFVFVVTGVRLMISRTLAPQADLSKVFTFSYRVRGGQVEVTDSGGWEVEFV